MFLKHLRLADPDEITMFVNSLLVSFQNVPDRVGQEDMITFCYRKRRMEAEGKGITIIHDLGEKEKGRGGIRERARIQAHAH